MEKRKKLNLDELQIESYVTSSESLNQTGGQADASTPSIISASLVSVGITYVLSCDSETCNLTSKCLTTGCNTVQYTGCDGECTQVC